MWVWAGVIAFSTVLASLYTGPRVWIAVSLGFAFALLLTFVLPVLHRPGQPAPEPIGAVPVLDGEPHQTL